MHKAKSYSLVFILIIIAGILFYELTLSRQMSLPALQPAKNKRILIISPHPDDETIATSGLIMKALKDKDAVRVVVMTYGNSYLRATQFHSKKLNPLPEDFKKLGVARYNETLRAMTYLGLQRSDVRFLGYPDGGLIYLWRKYWDYDNPRLSHSLNVNKVPYDTAIAKGALFCGKSVVESLTREIDAFQPTEIYYPVTFDDHPDHWATGAFVKYVLYHSNYKNIKQYSYLVHRNYWPQPYIREKRKLLSPPKALIDLTYWVELSLTNDEIRKKDYALNLYTTQRAVMQPFFWSFIRKTELFAIEKPLELPRLKDVSEATAEEFGIIKDAKADTLARLYDGAGDIESIRVAMDNNNLRFILKTCKPISATGRYFIQANLIEKNGASRRLTCLVKNKKLVILKVSKDSPNAKISSFSLNGSTIDFTLKGQGPDSFKEIINVLLSAYTQNKKAKDQTELKVFEVK